MRTNRPAAILAIALGLAAVAGCASVPAPAASGLYAEPIGAAPVTSNDTAYTPALICMAKYARQYRLASPRIAVGRITDYTGKQEDLQGGPKLTQGATLMAITALAKAGARMVERYDNSVSELELRYANGKLISDAGQAPGEFRKIPAGVMAGSDYVLIGGITELNFNIRSSGSDVAAGGSGAREPKGQFRNRTYVMNVGIDLRLVDTRTSEIVDVISYQKQIVGHEISAGLFSFLGDAVADLSAGKGGLEPMQMAVRAQIERAALEIMSGLYQAPGPEICLGPDGDPLNARPRRSAGGTPYRPMTRTLTWSSREP